MDTTSENNDQLYSSRPGGSKSRSDVTDPHFRKSRKSFLKDSEKE